MEMLFVLLIVSMSLSLFVYNKKDESLDIFLESILYRCLLAQEEAFSLKRPVHVNIEHNFASFGKIDYSFPKSIVCEANQFHYNERGNISKALTIRCRNNVTSANLVFQLGSGRVRVQKK